MTYVTIETKTAQAKKFVELIETLPFAKILKDPNAVTKKARSETCHQGLAMRQTAPAAESCEE